MNFGEKIKQLRAERNLTQPKLAQVIGIEQSYLSKLENDKSVPSADIFQAILRAFSIDVTSFLEGVDDTIVHRDLKQIPEVAKHLGVQVNRRIHSIKGWLFASAVTCVLGLTLAAAGYRGWLFSNMQYSYYSPGVILTGEPMSIFEILRADAVNRRDQAMLVAELNKRKNEQYRLSEEFRGEGFLEQAPGGVRSYRMSRSVYTERPQNRLLMFLGTLLTIGGILGFIVEHRLRSVRL